MFVCEMCVAVPCTEPGRERSKSARHRSRSQLRKQNAALAPYTEQPYSDRVVVVAGDGVSEGMDGMAGHQVRIISLSLCCTLRVPFRDFTDTSVVQQPGTVVVPFQEQQQQQPGTVVVPFPPYIPLLSVIRPLPICGHTRMQVIGEAICGCWRASSRRRQVRDHVACHGEALCDDVIERWGLLAVSYV